MNLAAPSVEATALGRSRTRCANSSPTKYGGAVCLGFSVAVRFGAVHIACGVDRRDITYEEHAGCG